MVPRSALTAPGGVAVVLEDTTSRFAQEAHAGPGVVLKHLEPGNDLNRMRAVTDPRLGDLEAEFGTPYRICPEALAPRGLPGAVEVHAGFGDTRPELGARVLVAHTRPATDTRWLAIAWLKPCTGVRGVSYHTLPPDLLAHGPLWLRVEVMYWWPLAILQHVGQQDIHVPWLFLAAPR